MDQNNSSGIFPSTYHKDNLPSPQPPIKPTKKSSNIADLVIGIILGIFQFPFIAYICFMVASVPVGLPYYLYYLLGLVILAIELYAMFKKGKNYSATGVIIGTILVPVLFMAICSPMLSGL